MQVDYSSTCIVSKSTEKPKSRLPLRRNLLTESRKHLQRSATHSPNHRENFIRICQGVSHPVCAIFRIFLGEGRDYIKQRISAQCGAFWGHESVNI